MYTHQQQWSAALRVAQAHDAASVTTILRQKGDALVAGGKLADAEAVFTQAHSPERAVRAYRDAGLWDDALRVARQWQPELVAEIEAARSAAAHGAGGSSDGSAAVRLQQARMLERQVLPIRLVCGKHATVQSMGGRLAWATDTRWACTHVLVPPRGRTKQQWMPTWSCRRETAPTRSCLRRRGRPALGWLRSICAGAPRTWSSWPPGTWLP